MKFRGFVFQRRLICLSQYNYLIYSQRLCHDILEKIERSTRNQSYLSLKFLQNYDRLLCLKFL